MFGVVPKSLWQRACPPDEQNRISMGCQTLVLRRKGRVVLIDAGLGGKWDDKGRAIYGISRPDDGLSPLETALASLSLRPEEVTDVIVTHLHFDHAGGLTHLNPEGKLTPTFRNARHWVQSEHLDWARGPAERERGSFPSENIEPLVEADLFALTRGEEEVFSGLGVIPLYGHTKAMQSVLIEGDQPLYFPTDLLPMKAHLHLPYIMAYDIDPLTTLSEKKSVLARALADEWLLYLQHEPTETVGRVERFGGKYRWGKA
jgi:glyoxylase-like metal-dependent hydrolase (beta-lactamase superfamily II)